MSLSRRNFLGGSTAFGLLSAALADSEVVNALSGQATASARPTFGEQYWSSLYADNSSTRGAALKHMTPEERIPAIYHFSDKTSLRPSEQIKTDELPDFDDEAVVTIELTGFRPGLADKEALSRVNFANMHLSCERVSGSQFIGPLAWATLATVFSQKAKGLPAVNALDWSTLSGEQNTGTTKSANSNPRIQHLLLSHGAGHLKVNITTTPKESALDKVLKVAVSTSKILTPLLGFPAISTVALGAFYEFYGRLEAANRDNFLLSTARKDVVVAKQGLKVADMDSHPLYLLSGDYILVPSIHQVEFESKMRDLTLVNGFAVEAKSTGVLADRVKNAITSVSYLALSVRVQPASEVPNTSTVTDPVLGDHSTDGSTPASKKSGSTKTTHPQS